MRINPNNLPAHLMMGDVNLAQHKIGGAISSYNALIKIAPDKFMGYSRLGIAYMLKGEHDKAIGQLNKALEINPRARGSLANLINIYLYAKKEPSKAIALCKKYSDLSKNKAFIQYQLGRIYLTTKDYEKAKQSLTRAIEENKGLLGAYTMLANVYLAQGKIDEAINEYKKTIEIKPDFLQGYMVLGVLHDSQKKLEKADYYYKQALEIDPNFAPAANNLAWSYAAHGGNLDEAMDLAERAHGKMLNNPAITDTLGWIYYKKGLYLKAIGLFQEALKQAPQAIAIRYHLANAYLKKGEKGLAKKELETVIKTPLASPYREKARDLLKTFEEHNLS